MPSAPNDSERIRLLNNANIKDITITKIGIFSQQQQQQQLVDNFTTSLKSRLF
jgi:hypothetical protein